ncbi:MAG: peptide-methionine (S)-S-oxide reductase MsrA [Roseitalea sp.]|uniref:peptide-methionine (S)-S-oxide reductase MsrA n=1 Tax=Oceaniradius stylonematis TaxID=2184161 RepID=UPI000F3CBA80|nr:peptide-methionine (S)-S-oxide reductase MsrA [Oceaniradius stylonematis]MBO6554061.1 peptide-methionine (S)-S-oxide reductase MsrA [Roseitalea sp.]MBO6952815.1 peptide-methionine (S)-S-oxide reductase MsrA [Rhizobiaceae bacterium]RNC96731.1 MAG: peptide-methionine (S)-S-oxide reductase [Oricola sp.]MBO6593162.1 peptide-methionine (S)-S-oxide reductase MsrA [Roseitalea sp.]MBO6600848.1 peptide-methionine (S)-S-oxide reductase MsrA [Roseitalea sp.]
MPKKVIHATFLAAALAIGAMTGAAQAETRSLIVAGGCFWCVESDFDHVAGVVGTTSGYAGGEMQNPVYRNHGRHREVVKIDYDSTVTDYKTLIEIFLRTVDPLDAGGQFCDRGRSYETAIHAANDAEKMAALEAVNAASQALGQEVVIPVEGPVTFWRAEDYHQDYYLSQERQLTRFGYVTRAEAYKGYRKGCGRDARVRQIWGAEAYRGVDKPAT